MENDKRFKNNNILSTNFCEFLLLLLTREEQKKKRISFLSEISGQIVRTFVVQPSGQTAITVGNVCVCCCCKATIQIGGKL